METITYRKKLKITWKDDLLLVSFSTFLLGLSLTFNRTSGWRPFAEWGADEILAVTVLLICLLTAAGFFRLALPSRNSLQLNLDGLTYKSAGHGGTWFWRDVSAFEQHRLVGGPLIGRRRAITFAAPGKDWTWRWLRWAYGLPAKPPVVVIQEMYDTPVDEIAAALNAYRERVVGGGAA
jgi:hypothetical protein